MPLAAIPINVRNARSTARIASLTSNAAQTNTFAVLSTPIVVVRLRRLLGGGDVADCARARAA